VRQLAQLTLVSTAISIQQLAQLKLIGPTIVAWAEASCEQVTDLTYIVNSSDLLHAPYCAGFAYIECDSYN
jgi:hypothetical protein